jgi:hypothetical protein
MTNVAPPMKTPDYTISIQSDHTFTWNVEKGVRSRRCILITCAVPLRYTVKSPLNQQDTYMYKPRLISRPRPQYRRSSSNSKWKRVPQWHNHIASLNCLAIWNILTPVQIRHLLPRRQHISINPFDQIIAWSSHGTKYDQEDAQVQCTRSNPL